MFWNSPNVMVLSASEMTAVIVASPSAAVTETKGWETSEGHFSSSSEHEAIRNAPMQHNNAVNRGGVKSFFIIRYFRLNNYGLVLLRVF